MLKQILVIAATAVVATLLTLRFAPQDAGPEQSAVEQLSAHIAAHESDDSGDAGGTTPGFTITEELEQDAWLRGMSRDGSPRPGPADDAKPLANSSNSICFLTKVEFTGLGDQEDTTSCKITIDDFTGWWQVNAIQADGTDASVACNARCLIWE
jgi:hypothetical protein